MTKNTDLIVKINNLEQWIFIWQYDLKMVYSVIFIKIKILRLSLLFCLLG